MSADPIRVLFVCTHNSPEARSPRHSWSASAAPTSRWIRRAPRSRGSTRSPSGPRRGRHRLDRRPSKSITSSSTSRSTTSSRSATGRARPAPCSLARRTRSTGASRTRPRSRAPTRRSSRHSAGPRRSSPSASAPSSRSRCGPPGGRVARARLRALAPSPSARSRSSSSAAARSPNGLSATVGRARVRPRDRGHDLRPRPHRGAHFNPAVSMRFAVGRHMPWSPVGHLRRRAGGSGRPWRARSPGDARRGR